jgi:argininosuccinate lyase
LLKLSLLRGIDVCAQTLDIMADTLTELVFDEATIRARVNPSIRAADQAYDSTLKEGIPLRDACKRVAATLKT